MKGELFIARVNAFGIWRIGDYYIGLYNYIQYLYAVTNTCIGNGMCWVCDGRKFTGESLEARIKKIEKLILLEHLTYLTHFQALFECLSSVEIKMNIRPK